MSGRHEGPSTVLTSKQGCDDWGEILGDEVMPGTVMDPVTRHCPFMNIRGNSYGTRQHSRLAPLTPAQTDERPGRRGSRTGKDAQTT